MVTRYHVVFQIAVCFTRLGLGLGQVYHRAVFFARQIVYMDEDGLLRKTQAVKQ